MFVFPVAYLLHPSNTSGVFYTLDLLQEEEG